MKAIFIAYNQAYNEEIVELLAQAGRRGFTRWEETGGRGSLDGEPHQGNHAELRRTDAASPKLGLRAYSWPVEEAL